MPPLVALVLCVAAVVFLLRLDRRQFPEVTKGLWIPTLWLITASTKALGTWFGSSAANVEEGSAIDRNFLILMFMMGAWLLARRHVRLREVLRDNGWLMVLVAFMLISISWSSVPFVSFKRWFREIIAIVMGLLVLTENDAHQAIRCVIKRTVHILIPTSVLLIKYFPQYGIDYAGWTGARMWIGVTDQKNELGQLTCLAAFFMIWELRKKPREAGGARVRWQTPADLTVLGTALYLSKGSDAGYSATALVMLAFGLLVYVALLWLRRKGRIPGQKAFVIASAVLILYGTATPIMGRLPVGDISSQLGRDSTLTERTVNWSALIPVALSKPLAGHGVGGFWTSDNIDRFYYPAHNGYLEILLTLGILGLILMSGYLLDSARKARHQLAREYDWGVLWICWLTMAMVNNFAESSLHSFANILMAIPIWFTISFQRDRSDLGPGGP